ncbi:alpha-1,2-mannosidase, putative [Chitinophaga terrae (ex Kim and Jung 2007)]|uniref:Alpha-1,2-mannosidase, putative n=1 Tax=Chitinophaga terrae (ex Kim and Jung 2007) TaxID=408074 RepID=A0A1H4BBI6_9BACT|nr:GH92 family glycosyl hydrolase [Chitinophaga terrae (ex Kim and Jung 2007)]GEP92128.1 hypothetical protein CTE07_37730 [Chitinophaga terrae (ex Kim and Jung 2007)]SEA45509.1 alpha-1,2-mannosidase, putative [Chitinophaga terrae (ex Kim and Jung 2007)]
MRNYLLGLLIGITPVAYAQQHTPADYVNPFIGASTSTAAAGVYHGLGKTFPGATTPFGLVQVSPNTITGGDNGSGYSYEHQFIEGFAFTQMSGIGWYGDLGNFLVTPATGPLRVIAGRHAAPGKGYRSGYDKSSEIAEAGYYSVMLTNPDIRVEASAAPHSGMLRFVFPQHKQSRIQVDLARRVGGTAIEQSVEVVNANTIEGWMKCTPEGGGWGNGDGKADYIVYFHAEFSKPLKNYGYWNAHIPEGQSRKREAIESAAYDSLVEKAAIVRNTRKLTGKHIGFFTEFETKANETVTMKAGISFVSVAGARENLAKEISGWNFESVRKNAKELWNQALSKATIEGGTEEQKHVFYTALYHTMIDPRSAADVNGFYTGGDGQVHRQQQFTKRTIFSGWDVFRSQFPLQSIINPTVVNDMINSLVELGTESKKNYLERWELLNAYSGCMIGNPAVVVINDAYSKGIRNFDIAKAYTLAKNSVEKFGNGERGYADGISQTLEYAFSEWALSQFAKQLGHTADAAKYAQRAKSYQNLFDSTHHWFRAKNADGSWQPWNNGGRIAQPTLESNAYQQGWFVPHDLDGLVSLLGGKEKVIADLEDLFNKTPENFSWNDYYNHANEPVHHVPFLFNRLGAPWLTQYWSRVICEKAYHNSVEGLVGNEDVGQMSAWYVLAASGLHPVCPGDNLYEITSPVFDKVTFRLEPKYAKGKTFTVVAKNNSANNKYIQSMTLNGKPYTNHAIRYEDIAAGGVLELTMGPEPVK